MSEDTSTADGGAVPPMVLELSLAFRDPQSRAFPDGRHQVRPGLAQQTLLPGQARDLAANVDGTHGNHTAAHGSGKEEKENLERYNTEDPNLHETLLLNSN